MSQPFAPLRAEAQISTGKHELHIAAYVVKRAYVVERTVITDRPVPRSHVTKMWTLTVEASCIA
jgi:hypothetical protein